MDPHDALRHYFQFPEFRPGQEDALRQVPAGSAAYLAPIKALLPAEIDYGVIRCVVEAWKREQPAAA